LNLNDFLARDVFARRFVLLGSGGFGSDHAASAYGDGEKYQSRQTHQERDLAVYSDPELRLAISRCVAIETSRGWRIAKDKAAYKIDVVVALAMAALGAIVMLRFYLYLIATIAVWSIATRAALVHFGV
jgi:hypothetical protein